MYIYNRFIYLQLHKTGCSHIARLLNSVLKGIQFGKHNRLPANFDYQDAFIVGSIRNPWDWYVSLWAFGCGHQGDLFNQLCNQKKTGDYWKSLYSEEKTPEQFRRWLTSLHSPEFKTDIGGNYLLSPVSCIAGLLTYRYLTFFISRHALLYQTKIKNYADMVLLDQQHNILDYVIKNEQLESDLIDSLRQANIKLSVSNIEHIMSANKTNTSSRVKDLSFYYDEETSSLVSQRESLIIHKYNYLPPSLG